MRELSLFEMGAVSGGQRDAIAIGANVYYVDSNGGWGPVTDLSLITVTAPADNSPNPSVQITSTDGSSMTITCGPGTSPQTISGQSNLEADGNLVIKALKLFSGKLTGDFKAVLCVPTSSPGDFSHGNHGPSRQ